MSCAAAPEPLLSLVCAWTGDPLASSACRGRRAMSNHLHIELTDPEERHPEFTQEVIRMIAKARLFARPFRYPDSAKAAWQQPRQMLGSS